MVALVTIVGQHAVVEGTGGSSVAPAKREACIEGGGGFFFFKQKTAYDILSAGSGNNTLHGGAGDDLLYSGAGNDLLDGGTGNDTASYAHATG
ncbi:hypothetical protein B1218_38640 [Pseudomonas ogarae]|nr:hypothetical protein B1218_38640 [Pseudomonas ogarae]